MLRFLLLLACCAGTLSLEAQSFTTFNYTVADGLPSSEVYDVYQDKQGFLWFGTDNGVVRYDGRQFEIFHTKDSLSDPVVFRFHEDAKGRIWFRSFSGKLSYYDNGKIFRYRYNDALTKANNLIIMSMYCDSLDNVWFTNSQMVAKIDSLGNLSSRKIAISHFEFITIGKGHLAIYAWSPHKEKVIVIDGKEFIITLDDPLQQNSLTPFQHWKHKLFFAIDHHLFQYDGKALTKIRSGSDNIISLSVDKEDHLWIGYKNTGAERVNAADFSASWRPEFLKEKSVTRVLHDAEGGYWFTTLEKGIFYVPNMDITNHQLDIHTKITDVFRDKQGVLVGDQRGILRRYDLISKKETIVHENQSSVLTIFQTSALDYWVSTSHDIKRFDSMFKLKEIIPLTKVAFSENKRGEIFTVGGGYLAEFNEEGHEIRHVAEASLRTILATDSTLFIAGRTGFELRSPRDLNLIRNFTSLQHHKITSILQLNDTTVLLGSSGNGMALMHSRKLLFKWFNREHDFIASNIYSICKNDSMLWLGTERGLVEINIQSLLSGKPDFRMLGHKSGLLGDQVHFVVRGQNSIWAFTDNGFSEVPDDDVRFANNHPRFYLKDVRINQQIMSAAAYEALDYLQNNIKVSFGFISFNNNQNIISRFKLLDTDPWTYTTDRSLEFYSLAPGNYNLIIEASIDNAKWHLVTNELKFNIAAPLWKRWYFQLGFFFMVLGLGYLYFRNRYALVTQREQNLEIIRQNLEIVNQNQHKLLQSEIQTTERERTRIAKDLHDSVGTNMVALKMMVGQLLRKHHDPHADQVENQLQSIVQDIKEIIYDLSPPGIERYGLFSILRNLSTKLDRSSPATITLNTYGDDLYNPSLNIVILRIIQELLSNSLKHSRAKEINIYLNVFEERLNIIYEDNGIGFSYKTVKMGSGLSNIDTRLESINGQLKFESGQFGISYTIDVPVPKKNNNENKT